MPVIAMFAGIVIRMYFLESEHNPPHIHCEYGEFGAAVDIRTLQILDGLLPARVYRQVVEWASRHQEDLLAMWQTQVFRKLPPF